MDVSLTLSFRVRLALYMPIQKVNYRTFIEGAQVNPVDVKNTIDVQENKSCPLSSLGYYECIDTDGTV